MRTPSAARLAVAILALVAVGLGGYALGRAGARPGIVRPLAAAEPESVYVAARLALSAGRHREAATLFRRLWSEHPQSARAADAPFWEALAAQRAGTPEDLRQAVEALDAQRRRFPGAGTREEAAALEARIRGTLGIAAPAPPPDSLCGVRNGVDAELARLSELQDDDPAGAETVLRGILARPGCAAKVRRHAVMLLAQRPTPGGREALLRVVRAEPDSSVRAEAAFWLGAFPAPAVLPVLDSVARRGTSAEREQAIAAVAQLHTPESRQSLARLLRDPAVPLEDRRAALQAVMGFDPDSADAAQLRELYPDLHPRLRALAIQALGHVHDAKNAEWLLALALDPATPGPLAGEALFWSSRAGIPADRLVALYPRLSDRDRRERLLHAMLEAPSPAAEALLRQAAASDPDPGLRETASIWLRERLGKEP
ncbi:MAG TPA: HEAT repeat domain-containing protein [Longimicrobium sp.]|nr:HEAT repeat domain-containing protein [Longimicrobium sp.]